MLWLNAPDTPVMVTVLVPVVALPLAFNVSVLLVVPGLGLKDAVTPLAKPLAESVTLPVNPPEGAMVTRVDPP